MHAVTKNQTNQMFEFRIENTKKEEKKNRNKITLIQLIVFYTFYYDFSVRS